MHTPPDADAALGRSPGFATQSFRVLSVASMTFSLSGGPSAGRTQSCGLLSGTSLYVLMIGAHLKRLAHTDRANSEERRIRALKPARFRWSCSGSAVNCLHG